MAGYLKGVEIDKLISMLHESLEDAIKGMGVLIDEAKELDTGRVEELRDHVASRLGREDADAKRLLKLMSLISTEGAVIEILKEDAEEWLKLINVIDEHIKSVKDGSSIDDKDIKELEALSKKIKGMLRA
ncbi:MAG: hypothetical protein KGH58_00435 [Candidatus Micrarchaeota archaeon]|nr:hypothetical protein [Candidatus Micrarchaeota archaeon]